MKKSSVIIVAILLVFFIGFIAFINYWAIKENFIQRFVSQTNLDVASEVENKKQVNMALAVVLSKEVARQWPKEGPDLDEITTDLKRYTIYKNVWFKVLDKERRIIYSTMPLHRYRRYAKMHMKAPFFSDLIVDCYGLHISAFGEVRRDEKLLGYIEVISQFNSIRKSLLKEGIYAVTLLDKRFGARAKLATHRIGPYAIMDERCDERLHRLIEKIGVDTLLASDHPKVVESFVLYRYPLKNDADEIVGWIVYAKNMHDIFDQFLSRYILIRIVIMMVIVAIVLFLFSHYYQKERKRLLSRKATYYSNLLDKLQEIIIITDGRSIKFANASFFHYFSGYKSLEEFAKEHECICDFFVEEPGFLKAVMDGKKWVEFLIEHLDQTYYTKVRYKGREYIFQVKANRIDDEDYVVIFIDVTESYKRQERLRKLATRDPLTGLYNRYVFEKIAAEKVEEARILGDHLLFVMFDIDHFKHINDRYGHDKGDLVLKEVARLIRGSFRSTDPVFRIGGEEFMAILVTSSIERIMEILEDLRKRVEQHTFDGIQERVTISIGVAEYRKGDSVHTLYKRVDRALYISKNSGRNTITFIGANDE